MIEILRAHWRSDFSTGGDPDLVNFSDGHPSEFGDSGLDALSKILDLFVDNVLPAVNTPMELVIGIAQWPTVIIC